MKNYVITIKNNPKSVESAQRTIDSGKKNGIDIEMFDAWTPDTINLQKAFFKFNINKDGFKEKYSRLDNCMAAFLSHFTLWRNCMEDGVEYTIFEHDAVVQAPIPEMSYYGCVNIGKPSYGAFNTPRHLGVGPLVSKPYFPGAHAYRINPIGAELLVNGVSAARPTDVYLNNTFFPWLEEYNPWPVVANDSFTTIQNKTGCLAKHNYGEQYEII